MRAIVLLNALGEDPTTALRRARPAIRAGEVGMRFFRTPVKASFHRKIEAILRDHDLYRAALEKDAARIAPLRDSSGFGEVARRLLCGVGLLRPLFDAHGHSEVPAPETDAPRAGAPEASPDPTGKPGRDSPRREGPFRRAGGPGSTGSGPTGPGPTAGGAAGGAPGRASREAAGAARAAAPGDLPADDALWALVALECLDDLGLGEGVVAADLRQRRLLGYLRSAEARRHLTKEKPGRLNVMHLAFERIGGNGGRQAVLDLARRRLSAVGLDLGEPGAPGRGEAPSGRTFAPRACAERTAEQGAGRGAEGPSGSRYGSRREPRGEPKGEPKGRRRGFFSS